MAEEVQNPSLVVPRSIMLSLLINGSFGFAMVLVALFCMGDGEAVLNPPTGFPFMEIFRQATNSIAASTIMSSLILVLGLCGTVGLFASTSRVFWSFARDRGLPGWKILSQVCYNSTMLKNK